MNVKLLFCTREKGMSRRNIIEDQSFRLTSPVSVLECSSFTESYHSSDSAESNHCTGGKKLTCIEHCLCFLSNTLVYMIVLYTTCTVQLYATNTFQ